MKEKRLLTSPSPRILNAIRKGGYLILGLQLALLSTQMMPAAHLIGFIIIYAAGVLYYWFIGLSDGPMKGETLPRTYVRPYMIGLVISLIILFFFVYLG